METVSQSVSQSNTDLGTTHSHFAAVPTTLSPQLFPDVQMFLFL